MPVAHRTTGGAAAASVVKLTTDSAVDVGTPVYGKAGGTIDLAAATSRALARVVGLSEQVKGVGFPVRIVLRGIVARLDWTAIAGTVGLTPGAPYFLSVAAGKITSTAPSAAGELVARVGRAVSATELDVQTEQQTIGL